MKDAWARCDGALPERRHLPTYLKALVVGWGHPSPRPSGPSPYTPVVARPLHPTNVSDTRPSLACPNGCGYLHLSTLTIVSVYVLTGSFLPLIDHLTLVSVPYKGLHSLKE